MYKSNIQIGDIYGNWTVIRENGRAEDGSILYDCKCECGTTKPIRGYRLKNHTTTKCKKCSTKELRVKNTQNFGCMICGSDKHCAKGLCRNCYEKDRKMNNTEVYQKIKERNRKYREEHKEEIKQYQKKYREEHKI